MDRLIAMVMVDGKEAIHQRPSQISDAAIPLAVPSECQLDLREAAAAQAGTGIDVFN